MEPPFISLCIHYVSCMSPLGCHGEVPQAGDFNNRNELNGSDGGRKSRIQMPTGLVPGGGSLPDQQVAAFSLSSRGLPGSERAERTPGVSTSSRQDSSPVGLGPPLNDLISHNYLLTGPGSTYGHIGCESVYIWLLGTQFSL